MIPPGMATIRSCLECGALFTGSSCPNCREKEETTKRIQAASPPLGSGQRFHGLEVIELLDRGGMGLVYKARAADGTVVALKILPPEKALDPQFGGRFGRETRVMKSLSHPNIVAIHEFGFERDLYFLTMEYVDGTGVRQLIEGGSSSRSAIGSLLFQLLDALEYAHGRGIVHRDIKPENLIVEGSGRLKVLDFGLAKMMSDEYGGLTETFTALGSEHYMAPEQMENAKNADSRADLYSAGVVLYEMLTGRPPETDPPTHPDRALESVLRKALARDRNSRYATAAEFRASLARSL